MKQQQSYRSLENKKQTSNNDTALNVVNNEANSTPIGIDVVSPFTNKPKLLRSSSKTKIDNQQAIKQQPLQQQLASNNNNLEYNPLNGVSFKPTHASDVEIVGVKLGNSNQDSYSNNQQAARKKNSLKSRSFFFVYYFCLVSFTNFTIFAI